MQSRRPQYYGATCGSCEAPGCPGRTDHPHSICQDWVGTVDEQGPPGRPHPGYGPDPLDPGYLRRASLLIQRSEPTRLAMAYHGHPMRRIARALMAIEDDRDVADYLIELVRALEETDG